MPSYRREAIWFHHFRWYHHANVRCIPMLLGKANGTLLECSEECLTKTVKRFPAEMGTVKIQVNHFSIVPVKAMIMKTGKTF